MSDDATAHLIAALSAWIVALAAMWLFGSFPDWATDRSQLVLLIVSTASALAALLFLGIGKRVSRRGQLGRAIWAAVGGAGALALAATFSVTAQRSVPHGAGVPVQSEQPSAARDRQVLLIGLDGADWRRIDQLMAAGRLPTFRRLSDHGVRAVLQTEVPTASPILWTTIATGMLEEQHGIHGFVEARLPGQSRTIQGLDDPRFTPPPVLLWTKELQSRQLLHIVPITSRQRRAKALWNILSDAGLQTGVVNWYATWPSDAVLGYFVSDNNPWRSAYVERRCGTTNPPGFGITHPPELLSALANVELPAIGDAVDAILELDLFSQLDDSARQRLRDQPELLSTLRTIVLSDAFAAGAGLALLSRERLSFLAVYLSGIDNFSHRLEDRATPSYPDVIDRYYEFVDRTLAQYVSRTDENSSIIVLSDHGWDYDRNGVWGHHTGPDGMLLMAGRGIRRGLVLSASPRLIDVAPTVLALFGLPTSREMAGQPLRHALTAQALRSIPVESIASYGPYLARSVDDTRDEKSVEETLEKLRALGYIE